MKKVLVSVLFGASLISLAPTSNANFKDLALGHKNVQAIEFLQDTDVIGGYEDGTFKPGNAVNRAELAKILVEAQGITPDAEQYNNCFSDVTDEWFAPYVCYAKEMEWVDGYKDGTFKPEQIVNKVESIKMVINSQGFENEMEACTEELYEDTDENAWYAKFLCVAKAKGLLEEDENGNYVPAEGMTRGNVAENIYRSIMVRKLNKVAFTDEIKDQVDEVKSDFKADREEVKTQLQAAKAEIQAMIDDSATDEEIQAARDSLWEDIKTANQENREEFAEKMKEIQQDFKEEKDQIREKFQECKEEGMVYKMGTETASGACVEKPECDNDGTGSGNTAGNCASPLKKMINLKAK